MVVARMYSKVNLNSLSMCVWALNLDGAVGDHRWKPQTQFQQYNPFQG